MARERLLRAEVSRMLGGADAHPPFERVLLVPPEARGAHAQGMVHTAWELLEHLRIAQQDILRWSRGPDYVSPPWPEGFWPPEDAPPGDEAWDRSVAAFRRDLDGMRNLVADPHVDLLAPIPWSDEGVTILHEALLVADHNAWHLAQIVVLRRALGVWES